MYFWFPLDYASRLILSVSPCGNPFFLAVLVCPSTLYDEDASSPRRFVHPSQDDGWNLNCLSIKPGIGRVSRLSDEQRREPQHE